MTELSRARETEQAGLDSKLPHDPLLACLVLITKIHDRVFSPQSLIAGLPLVDQRLTPQLFIRAAERADLAAKVVKQKLDKLTNAMLPAVLLLDNDNASVLVEITNNNQARIIQPESGEGYTEIPFSELATTYSGYSIFVKPKYHFDERTGEAFKPKAEHWFWSEILRNRTIYYDVLIASFFINLFALAIPLFIMNVYDRVIPNYAIETLWALAIGIFIVFCFDFLMRNLRAYFIDNHAKVVDARISAHIFAQIMDIKMAARPKSTGVFANNIHAFESFRDFITSATVSALVDVPFVLLFILIIAFIGGPLFWIPLLAAPLIVGIGYFIQIPLQELVQQSYRFSAEKQATLYETLTGVETIKTIGAQSAMQRKWERVICLADKLGVKIRFLSSLAVNSSVVIQQFSTVFVVIFGVYLIANGKLTLGALIACTILTGRALAPMTQVAGLLMRYFQSVMALKSLEQVMNLPVERPRGKRSLHRPVLHGKMEFRQVAFNYPGQTVSALNNINCKINPGEKVALIGRIGSGKTTFGKLILGLHDPTSGAILLDGTDIHQIDPIDLRRSIGYLAQDIMLFYGSVKDNITCGAPYLEDSALMRAAQLAGVDSFVKLHPDGFDMQVGERGENLSGGQRQAVVLARTLLLDPQILVLDEPTNSMDETSERNFRVKLMAQLAAKTLVLITHKASMLALVDRLIVLDHGQVLADGEKTEILTALREQKIKTK